MAPICPTSGAAPTVAAYDTEPPLRRGEPPLAASGWRHTTPTDGPPMSSAATLDHSDPRVAAHDTHRRPPDVVRRHPRPLAAPGWRHTTPTHAPPMSSAATFDHPTPRWRHTTPTDRSPMWSAATLDHADPEDRRSPTPLRSRGPPTACPGGPVR